MRTKRRGKGKSLPKAVVSRVSKPVRTSSAIGLPAGYPAFLEEMKGRIRAAQIRAALSANRELVRLYWTIGRDIVGQQQAHGWGRAVIERLAADLRRTFPQLSGFSPSNLWRMRSFYVAYARIAAKLAQPVREIANSLILAQPVREIPLPALPEPLADIPWGHNVLLIERLDAHATRLWYARQTLVHGWSRNILAMQISSRLHERQGKAVNNFAATLPPAQSDLAQQVLKDPYVFDFLNLGPEAQERDLEDALLSHITRFLLELGAGFAFLGRQVRVEVDGDDYSIDLLFYHVKLHCYVVLDLKTGGFMPEAAGKMNFYLSAVDDLMKAPGDALSIGLILCREKKRITAEYALRDLKKPIGVAAWETRITANLPKTLRGSLPTVAELERELTQEPHA